MRHHNIVFIFLFTFFSNGAFLLAQSVKGTVKDEKGQPIIGAHVYWMDKSAEVLTDENGLFDLPQKSKSTMIHVEFVGFEMVMLTLKQGETEANIVMKEPKQLNAVEVSGRRGDNRVSTLDPHNVEKITSNELRKAPCCNLSESFETNGTVDIQYADAITGAKEIQMLGLRGIYTQLLVENRPDFYGLAMPYALEYLPGTWLKGIDINKGVGSVKNGFQSITGQINTSLVQPAEDAPVFINLFGESTGRTEANVHLNKVTSENFAHQLLLHGSTFQNKIDRDNDRFVDIPLKQQLNGMYRAFYSGKSIESQFQLHALTEERKSGQLVENQGLTNPFLINAKNNRLSAGLKLGYIGFEKPYEGLGSQWTATYHDVNAFYGKNKYLGTQKSYFGNIIYSTIIGTTDNKITFGSSLQYDDFKEKLNDRDLSRTDIYTGAYSEYVYSRPNIEGYNDITIVAGLRGDYHNRFGFVATPRINFKYNFNEGDVVRVAAGRGWRVANPIAENVAFLATNRQIVIAPDLKPEDAWNFGINFVKTFKISKLRELRWSIDAYRTQFQNQIITDIESDYNKAQFYNLNGKSYSNTILTMITAEILRGLDVKLAYKFNDVKTTYQGKLEEVPLVAQHRGLVSVDYKTVNKKWMFNATTQIVGPQRLADRHYLPEPYHQHVRDYSPIYTLTNFSINRFFKKIEVYGGVENLFEYTQHMPIIAWEEPTSEYFDATQVYAPMMGRRIYMGLRWRIGGK
jgi:outer membrane receptor for ferrienterochelin and colicins